MRRKFDPRYIVIAILALTAIAVLTLLIVFA